MGEKKKKAEDELVDAGSEYSFPASDPPSYMGGSAVAGPPPQKEPPREPVSKTVSNPEEVKPAGDGLPNPEQAEADKSSKTSSGKKP
ncbi:hypothetical protein [Microvirga zambiensis]|uniref:hypothetical protein n=1 Tax=Microvirga zambiensis TaxID=1402137 RepID=UPI00191E6FE7|nr:hypothetical protein [Microvirga zambiensis]